MQIAMRLRRLGVLAFIGLSRRQKRLCAGAKTIFFQNGAVPAGDLVEDLTQEAQGEFRLENPRLDKPGAREAQGAGLCVEGLAIEQCGQRQTRYVPHQNYLRPGIEGEDLRNAVRERRGSVEMRLNRL